MRSNIDKEEVSSLQIAVNKLWRIMTGEYEGYKKDEVDILRSMYIKYFEQVPEILNLGENYDKRIEISRSSFNNYYWLKTLKGNTLIYNDIEDMIDIMCSYEMEKINRNFQGYTDDPVHLFFYDVKCYLIKLSNARFDTEDMALAHTWQQFLRELVFSRVFETSQNTNSDTRVQVLFDLEMIMRCNICPKLQSYNENKAAIAHLESVCSYFEKLSDTVCAYLFYVARTSEYLPNFSMRKLQLLYSEHIQFDTLGLTQSEKDKLSVLKDTLPLKLLYEVFKKAHTQMQQDILALTSREHISESYQNSFSEDLSDTIRQMSNGLVVGGHVFCEKNYYAQHISLNYFVTAHQILKELNKFKELFYAAKACAVMGGDLLTFGLLRNELLKDVSDCSRCLYALQDILTKIEGEAWDAFRCDAKIGCAEQQKKPFDNWRDNYTKAAHHYFNIVKDNCGHVQSALCYLSAATIKKSQEKLMQETQQVIQRYRNIHYTHADSRRTFLTELDYSMGLNVNLSINPIIEPKLTGDVEIDSCTIQSLIHNHQPMDMKKVQEEIIKGVYQEEPYKASQVSLTIFQTLPKTPGSRKDLIKNFKRVIKSNPDDVVTRFNLVKTLYQEGRVHFENNEFNEAETCFSIATVHAQFIIKRNLGDGRQITDANEIIKKIEGKTKELHENKCKP